MLSVYIWINIDTPLVQVKLRMEILHECWFVNSSLFGFFFFPFLGWTPLHEASNKGSHDIIVELLKAGANVNCENLDGILPLHDAAANSHLKVQCTSDCIPITFLRKVIEENEDILNWALKWFLKVNDF